MKTFESFGLHAELGEALAEMNYVTPTPIQAQTIPFALEGRDILGTAQTGTGKTGAFAIPVLHKLIEDPESVALILTPTRELAMQVMDVVEGFIGRDGRIRGALLIGGAPMGKQLRQLKYNPQIIVGTPGRVYDHIDRRTLDLSRAKHLVLDEADRMLDMGFGEQIDVIVKHLPKVRQTLMFSATLPKNIIRLSQKHLNNPERIAMGATNLAASNLKQEIVHLHEDEKTERLMKELDEREGSILVFVKTRRGADKLAFHLSKHDYEAKAIHGDLPQSKRERVINAFRAGKCRILVATDVVARGLDIPHIEHVINYDLPQCPEDYIHRIGRTARAGAQGSSLCLIAPADRGKWNAIDRMMNPDKEFPKSGRSEGRSGGRGGRRPFRSGGRGGFAKKGNGGGFSRGRDKDKGGDDVKSLFGGEKKRGAGRGPGRSFGGFKKGGFNKAKPGGAGGPGGARKRFARAPSK